MPGVFETDGRKLTYTRAPAVTLRSGWRYLVNVGSVGQPRDGNPKAAYVIYDLDEGSIELRRLDYDIAKAQQKILEAGLPPRLADRLAVGK